jgi:4-amino-4-deoxy-L-arabinose transferase-like glycosyltransferase
MNIRSVFASPILLAAAKIGERIVAAWDALATRWNPIIVILVAVAVLTVPLIFLRGFHSDEGVAVNIAKAAIEDGHWLTPYLLGNRYAERPTLLSWIIAAASWPFGNVSQFSARFPVALFLLLGCALIFTLLRRVSASVPAALLGVALFLACPIVIRSYVMPTADMPLAVLLFLAFIVWWQGYERDSLGIGRWSAIGALLALAGLMKGPQPVGYFALGVGLFILLTRSWRQIPGFVLAGVICIIPLAGWYAAVYSPGDETQWATFMRFTPIAPLSNPFQAILNLISETLPALLFAVAFLVAHRSTGDGRLPPGFVKAIMCYAAAAAVVILFWPGGSATRYFFPSILPMCVLGGLGYDALMRRRPLLIAPGLLLTLGLLIYSFIYSDIAAPLLPQQFRKASIDAARIAELVRSAPAPLLRTGSVGLNIFAYMPPPIVTTDMAALKAQPGPAWIAVEPAEAAALIAQRPKNIREVLKLGQDDEWRLLRLDR